MKAKLIKFCYKAVEEKMLKIYATIMTTIFLAIWVPTMAIAIKNMFKFWIEYLF
jgi:hypothetical protein|tara:strand:- start:338 stop:499 length:162 start_codon:yes stop_codon:yes gene_type:complete